MMIIISEHIRELLKQTWLNLSQIWLTDPQYEIISQYWLKNVVDECSLKETFMKDVWDCDNYALRFHAAAQLYQYRLIESGDLDLKHSWAIGECIGFNEGVFSDGIHSQNLAITDKGIVLIEPQDGTIKEPDESYIPFFVKF